MTKYAWLTTGIGTSSTSNSFYGPFTRTEDVDAFVEKIRMELAKLKKFSGNAVRIVDDVPHGWSAIRPEDFQGFIQA